MARLPIRQPSDTTWARMANTAGRRPGWGYDPAWIQGERMARKYEPRPWGISAFGWQAVAFVLAGLIALTNAAWFYQSRVAKVDAAAAMPAQQPNRLERVIYQTPDGQTVPPPVARPTPSNSYTPTTRRERIRPLNDDEQCIQGQRFRQVENGFIQIQQAC